MAVEVDVDGRTDLLAVARSSQKSFRRLTCERTSCERKRLTLSLKSCDL